MSYSFGPANTSLRTWVRERFVPLVMVVTSHSVETVCQEKNGLSFVELLRLYSEHTDLSAVLRVTGTHVRITQSRLRFNYAQSMEQPTAEAIDKHLRDLVNQTSESTLNETGEGKLQEGLEATPWFLKYREDFLRLLCFDAHETFDHPLGCIYAIASTEVDSLKAFEDLVDSMTAPPLMAQEYMAPVSDDDVSKLFVIVHDGSREGQTGLELAKEKVRIVQKEFGHDQCVLLLVNTSGGKEENRGTPPIAFESVRMESEGEIPKDGLGSYLSKADLERVDELVRIFVTRCFFPKLDARMGRLRSSVSYKRRGFAGKIMDRTSSLLKTSFSGIGREHVQSPGFKYYTDEAQMRHLADIYFLLGRYEDAREIFSAITVSKDAYPRFYAGVQLMLGLCHVMLAGYTDPGVYFNKAYDYYLASPGKISRMFATRTAMLHSALCTVEENETQAAKTLLKSYDREEFLRGALLLEQAGVLLLKSKPPAKRQFAFHTTLAGLWFYTAGLHRLALRCYNLVLDIYRNRHWSQIDEYNAKMMLTLHSAEGNNAEAFHWTTSMLTAQYELTPQLREEYMEWIVGYIRDNPAIDVSSIADFSLPLVHVDSTEVQHDGEVIYATAEATETENGVWTELESQFRDPYSLSVMTGLGTSYSLPEENQGFVVCGESIRLSCFFENPLHVAIEVTSAQLLFEFERTDASCSPTSSPVSIPERRFTLAPSEKAVMQLELVPMTPGRLRIIGLSWYLNGTVPGHRLFDWVSWQEEGNRMPLRAKAHCPSLSFVALEPVPRLRLVSAPVPVSLWKGELWKAVWDIETVGKTDVKNFQITSSSSDLAFSLDSSMDSGDRDGLFLKGGVYQMTGSAKAIHLQLALNPQTAGTVYVHSVIRYESSQSETPLRVRFVRHSFSVEVVEAINVDTRLNQSELSRGVVLEVEAENRRKGAEVRFHDVSVETRGYRIQPALPKDETFSIHLPPRQKVSHHFLIVQSKDDDEKDTDAESDVWRSKPDRLLRVALEWTASIADSENPNKDSGSGEEAMTRRGRLLFKHDCASLSGKIQLMVEGGRQLRRPVIEGAASFPIRFQLQNCSTAAMSVSFKAGEGSDSDLGFGWRQRVKMDKEDEEADAICAGPTPLPGWTWSGQTECAFDRVEPFEYVEVPVDAVCFFPGVYCVADYGCHWRSSDNPLDSGFVPGKPLYLNAYRDTENTQQQSSKTL